MEQLNDNKTYKKLTKEPTQITQKKNNELMKKLETKTSYLRNYVQIKKHTTLYHLNFMGLPNFHKANLPLRPIVNCI